MNRERLILLRDFLRRYRPRVARNFDMNDWGTAKGETDRIDCGTAACALGWATTIPELREAGLRFDIAEPVFERKDADATFGYDAAADLFAISKNASIHIFGSIQPYGVPKQGRPAMLAAADRIDDVLEGRVK